MLESIAFRKFCWLSSFGDYRLHLEILLFVYCCNKLNLGPISTRGVLDCLNLRNIRIQKCLKRERVLSLCLSFSKSGMAGLVSPGGQEDENKKREIGNPHGFFGDNFLSVPFHPSNFLTRQITVHHYLKNRSNYYQKYCVHDIYHKNSIRV